MEGLIFIAAIIFIIAKNIAKVKQQSENNQPQKPSQEPRQRMNREQFEELQRKITGEFFGQQNKNYQGVNRPNTEGYREEKSAVRNSVRYVSEEGSESNEGKCIEPNANHCSVEHFEDTVYANEIGSENIDFTHEDFVKGIIMAELISKPKSLQ